MCSSVFKMLVHIFYLNELGLHYKLNTCMEQKDIVLLQCK